jgi:hypothetical protein
MSMSSQVSINFYTKVELRSQFPKQWSWTIRNAATNVVCEKALRVFSSADDAWRDSQNALACFTPPQMVITA